MIDLFRHGRIPRYQHIPGTGYKVRTYHASLWSGPAGRQYARDARRMARQGWRVQTANTAGPFGSSVTVTYVR